MEKEVNSMIENIEGFRLPRYEQIPNVGLYLEQVVRYVNAHLAPLGESELTSSMVSNYVKQGLIPSPIKKASKKSLSMIKQCLPKQSRQWFH